MSDETFAAAVAAIAALADPTRRALYRYVAARVEPAARDEAATATGVPLHLATFHLDKLHASGLLDVEFRRPPGRRGPGAGRPAKRYRRSAAEFSVSLPAHRYDLAGLIMATALADTINDGLPVAAALNHAAREAGNVLGKTASGRPGRRPRPRAAALAAAQHILDEQGFEPRQDAGGLVLSNCPFRALAREFPGLICQMNLALVDGLLTALPKTNAEARLDPAQGRCCVRVTAT